MSLLRLCAFPRCLTGRIVLERSVVRVAPADRCLSCQTARRAAQGLRGADQPWTLQRRAFSARARAFIPKEDGDVTKRLKRVLKQSQLLDVLEARIQQLRPHVLLDVQIKAPPSGRLAPPPSEKALKPPPSGRLAPPPSEKTLKAPPSGRLAPPPSENTLKAPPSGRLAPPPSENTLKGASREKAEKFPGPRPGQTVAKGVGREGGGHSGKAQAGGKDGGREGGGGAPPGKGQASRWMEKLRKEKKHKTKEQQQPGTQEQHQAGTQQQHQAGTQQQHQAGTQQQHQAGTQQQHQAGTQQQHQAGTQQQHQAGTQQQHQAGTQQQHQAGTQQQHQAGTQQQHQAGTQQQHQAGTQQQHQAGTQQQHQAGTQQQQQPGTPHRKSISATTKKKSISATTKKKSISATTKKKSISATTKQSKAAKARAVAGEEASQVRTRELEEVRELQMRVDQRAGQGPSPAGEPRGQAWRLLEDREGDLCGDAQLATRSYLEACVFAGDAERAGRFLLALHRKLDKRGHLSVGAYNIMMRVRAKGDSLTQIGRLFDMIEEAGLKPNLTSYCAALECMGRANPTCSPHIINKCLRQMEEDGLGVDELFNRCVFRQDERDMVLRAINTVQPDYQPSTPPTPLCSSPLVEAFYTQRSEAHYPKLSLSQAELQEGFSRQLAMEQACTVNILSVEARKPVTQHMTKMRALLAEQRSLWSKSLLQAFRENKQVLAKTHQKDTMMSLYPYLCLLEDQDYIDIMMQSLSNLPPNGEAVHTMAKDLGSRVYTKFCVLQRNHSHIVAKLENIYRQYSQLLAQDSQTNGVLPREEWCRLEAELSSGPSLQSNDTPWPHVVMVELGIHLLDLMIRTLKVHSDLLKPASNSKLIPTLYHMYTFRSNRQVGFIKPHPILAQLQRDATEATLTFDSSVMPMLCPPVPWTNCHFGAFLLTPVKLMRAMEGTVLHELLLEKTPGHELHPVLDSLNQLGNAAWRINQPLLDIIISLFNGRGSEALDVPPPASEAPKIPRFRVHDPALSETEKIHLTRELMKAKKKASEMHSLRMTALYKLSIADHMRDQVFWFPHSMDFRGRTYPCPPHLNHLGSDLTRSILLFAEGKPLGARGLDWLKVHLVNLTGLKKLSSLAARLAFADSIMDDILDSADNPLDGKKWWMSSEDPWQTLGCCMEIANAHRSPDHTQFISHFPVHQDGSCNGLQHYAALGRDEIGATSVNLMPREEPQDVYNEVAQQVEQFRAQDAQQGVKVAQVLQGFVSRKVVKQTVMTVVYGVTRYGGRLQMEKRLSEIDDFPKEFVWEASYYLVRQVFSSLKEMFTGTREIQDWLTQSARLIAKSGSTVEWVTPLGLPIIQPYHHSQKAVVKTSLQQICLHVSHDLKVKPNTMKQKNAFPPNFIHSLDSTHMMLTALHCYSAGLTFVSIHDCFWTHALTVDTMNQVCREQFVALHSQPILQELSNFLLQKYCSGLPTDAKNAKFQEYRRLLLLLSKVPKTGDFDLQRVKESSYFFC